MTTTKHPALDTWQTPALIALSEGVDQVRNTTGGGGDTIVASSTIS